jgi:hypothetical protein
VSVQNVEESHTLAGLLSNPPLSCQSMCSACCRNPSGLPECVNLSWPVRRNPLWPTKVCDSVWPVVEPPSGLPEFVTLFGLFAGTPSGLPARVCDPVWPAVEPRLPECVTLFDLFAGTPSGLPECVTLFGLLSNPVCQSV